MPERWLPKGARYSGKQELVEALREWLATSRERTIGDTGGACHVGLTLTDGRSVKLLWAKSTLTYDSLHDAMSHWLNDRMVLGEPC